MSNMNAYLAQLEYDRKQEERASQPRLESKPVDPKVLRQQAAALECQVELLQTRVDAAKSAEDTARQNRVAIDKQLEAKRVELNSVRAQIPPDGTQFIKAFAAAMTLDALLLMPEETVIDGLKDARRTFEAHIDSHVAHFGWVWCDTVADVAEEVKDRIEEQQFQARLRAMEVQ